VSCPKGGTTLAIALDQRKRSNVTLSEKADYSLDFRGAITSLALLKLTRVFREMKSRQTLEIIGLDADTRSDLFRLLPAVAYELIALDVRDETSIRVHLRKT
jgi:TusA-related sulfurtransferase